MTTIAERLTSAYARIEQATDNAHRPRNSVKLLAVSKTKPVSDISQAYAAGHRMFGENYVQEGVDKIQQLQHHSDIEWHMIGPLQSNKTKLVAEHFDWVQSIDREKIAKRLNDQRPDSLAPLNCCIQININDETSKSGVSVDQVAPLVGLFDALPKLKLRGFMAIPKANMSSDEAADTFAQLQDLFSQYHTKLSNFDTLSVGMSDDLEIAIDYGSTMVRVGTAIFGART